jgi:DNA modification methylase
MRTIQQNAALNTVINGDCTEIMRALPWASVDFILTDPPYLVNYRDRSGRSLTNDSGDGAWLKPAFREMHRVLRPDSLCVSFYGWNKVDLFMDAWKSAGFGIVGHIVFRKSYASTARFLRYEHECAYLLAKGRPALPASPMPDVLDWQYSGNRLHPTQKPVEPMKKLIDAFTRPGNVVLDPFCGSGSTLLAARELGRNFIGIELDPIHCHTAWHRMGINTPSLACAVRSGDERPTSVPMIATTGSARSFASDPNSSQMSGAMMQKRRTHL